MNAPVTTRATEGLARRAFAVADVQQMVEVGLIPEDERIEVLGGEIVPMQAKGNRHKAIKGAVNVIWGKICPDDYLFLPETGLYLDEYTYLEPDFIVTERAVGPANIRGHHVLLAVEVADSSIHYDLKHKPAFFAAFGVHELWVIDAANRVVHVHTGPTPTRYATVTDMAAADRLVPTVPPPVFAFALDELPRL